MAMIRVPMQFLDDFNLVVGHYECSAGEVAIMKECARTDLKSAMRCFAAMAQELRQTNKEESHA